MLSGYLEDYDVEDMKGVNRDWDIAVEKRLKDLAAETDYCLGCETGLDDDAAHKNPYTGGYWPNCCVDPDGDGC